MFIHHFTATVLCRSLNQPTTFTRYTQVHHHLKIHFQADSTVVMEMQIPFAWGLSIGHKYVDEPQ